jgi:LmeA-like phospholipid-binding
MSSADTHPTQPLPDWAPAEPARKRRRAWPWIVAVVIVIGLGIGAWFAGEAIARNVVETTIREQIITQLSLPAGHEVDVTVEGAVLPQLIGGTLQDVTVSSDDVTVTSSDGSQLSGDVTVHATGIPIRGEAAAESATATIRLDEAQLRILLASIDGLPAESINLAAPDITAEVAVQFFGISFPIGIALTPTAVDGDIVLSPASLQLAGATITADELRDRFGGAADLVVKDYTVCIAEYVPAGVTLTGLTVEGTDVIANFDVDGAIISDPALQANGTCA